jgi:hypothetical protein
MIVQSSMSNTSGGLTIPGDEELEAAPEKYLACMHS